MAIHDYINRPGTACVHTAVVQYVTLMDFYRVVSEMVTIDVWPVLSKAKSTWFKDTFSRAYSILSLNKTLFDDNANPFAVLDL